MDFANGTISVSGDWGFGDGSDMLPATGDASGDGSGFLDLGVQAHLRFSCVLRPASDIVTDILPKRAGNEDTSTQWFTNCLSFLAGGVSLN